MERQHKKPAANTAASSPASSGSSSSSRSIHGSMSSAFLGVSSSTHSQSQRRSSPSLSPPPALAPLPGLLASRGSAATGGSASGSSSFQFHQISPSPETAAKRRPRPGSRVTHSLPSPFLSELSAIRRMGTNLFCDLNAQEMTQRPLLHGQQEQEMTRSSSSSLTMPHSHHHMPIPIGHFSGFPSASQQQQALTMRGLPGFAPPPLQQQQAQPLFSSLLPLPGGNFSGFPLPASQPQQMQPSSSSTTDLPSRTFSRIEPPAASQHFSTYLAPLPSGGTIFQSSSCSADHAQTSSDTELPSLPPSLEIRHYDLPPPPPFGQLSQNNGSSTESSTGFVQPSSSSEMYELPPLPESLQMPPLLLHQVKQEPVVVAPCLEPEIISLDDGDELSALVHSFASSHGHGSASLPNHMHEQPTNLELEGMHRLQLGGRGSEQSMTGAAEGVGVGQTWEAMPTPASVHDKVNNGGSSSSSIPWKCHGSMPMYSRSEEQALQQLSDLLSLWSSTASSSCDQSMGSSVAGSCQGSAAMPALANKFDMMSIDSSSCSARPQMPLNYSSLSVENSTPVPAVPKLTVGSMDRPELPLRPPALGAGASSSMSRRGGTKEHFFSEADMEKINKDNRLKELMKTEPKRVRRILRNREYVARLKVQKANHMQDLQRRADALKMECTSLSAQVQSHQEMVDSLKTGNRELQIKLKGLNEQANLSQEHNGYNDSICSLFQVFFAKIPPACLNMSKDILTFM
ncbi:unnamed protein product [Miscanthus lutarioriparius]|uniref:BZIP domain-containing protein n=1 Tax=Miscanthus lutarioriparius TaxID=422564 RepID=A0A811NI99_9POAL|nr:unnamed protein product [Miscanthus lutarioriparius]